MDEFFTDLDRFAVVRPEMGLVVFILENSLTFVALELLGFKLDPTESVERLCHKLLPALGACVVPFSPSGCAVVTEKLIAGDALLALWRHNVFAH